MKLSYVSIVNFRSIESARIDFAPSCRALIGINESGKTNILNALAMLSDEFSPVPDDIREPRPDEDSITEAYIRFVFRLTRLDKISILKSLSPKVFNPDKAKPLFEDGRTSLSDFVNSIAEALYTVDLTDQTKGPRYWTMRTRGLNADWLSPKPNTPPEVVISSDGRAPVPISKFSLLNGEHVPDTVRQHCEPISFKELQSLIGSAIIGHVSASRPDCFLWSYSDSQLLPPSVPLAQFVSAPQSYEPLRQMFSLAGHDDVADAVEEAEKKRNGMRNLLNRVSKAATKHMRAVWKDYKGIEVNIEPNGANIEVNIRDTYNLYDFSRRSDGFKRFISFLFLVSARTRTGSLKNVLYLHDEPDTGLHPSGARHLLSELIKVAKDNYVVFSTHSIFMIDRNRIDRHYIVTKSKEVTQITAADSSNFRDEEVLYNALEFSAFQLLEESNLLFEGWKDKRLFEVALTSRSDSAKELKRLAKKVGFCHAQGVKDVAKVSSLLEMAKRKWLVISDGDQPAIEHQRKYSWPDQWVRYDELVQGYPIVTSEDFWVDKKVTKTFQAICKRHAVELSDDLELSEEGKLAQIEGFLKRSGASKEVVRVVVSDVKDDLIETIKPSDLRGVYYEVMLAAMRRLADSPDDSGDDNRSAEL